MVWSFDVAVVPAGLGPGGRRGVFRPWWSRVVVAADGLVEAHLVAAQLGGVRGVVVEVLYRE